MMESIKMQKPTTYANWPGCLFWMFFALFILPIYLRGPFLRYSFGIEVANINLIMVVITVYLLAMKRDYTKEEIILCIIWLLLLIPLVLSSKHLYLSLILSETFQCWMPVFLIIQRIDNRQRKRLLQISLYVFDVFIVILLAIAAYERFAGVSLVEAVYNALTARGYRAAAFSSFVSAAEFRSRFFSLWGHPLTNAVLFNSFFILNDIYHRNIEKKYPKIIYFLIALFGVALCASKTGLVVICLCLVISNWENKKWLLVYAAGIAVLFFSGIFNDLLQRFTSTPLTTGRFTALVQYFKNGDYPLRPFVGYGSGTAYNKTLFPLKPGFEFPLMMYALDNGILFSIVYIGSIFIYYTRQILGRGQIKNWLCVSLLFAQINTYNGMSLRNQDVGWMVGVILMFAINASLLAKPRDISWLPGWLKPQNR